MIRNALLTATALAASTLAWVQPAQSQRPPQILMCVDLQTTWSANIVMEARDAAGNWEQIFNTTTVPSRRCQQAPQGATQVRFTVRSHTDGRFRNACQTTVQGDRNATLRVSGSLENPACAVS